MLLKFLNLLNYAISIDCCWLLLNPAEFCWKLRGGTLCNNCVIGIECIVFQAEKSQVQPQTCIASIACCCIISATPMLGLHVGCHVFAVWQVLSLRWLDRCGGFIVRLLNLLDPCWSLMDLHGSLIGPSLDNCWLPKPNFLDKWILAGQNCSCWSNGETEIGCNVCKF